MSVLPSGRKACFGINVTGQGLDSETSKGNVCSPTTGVIKGFVEAGQYLEVEVKKGKNRKIELLAYLQAPGANNSCPTLAKAMSVGQTTNTYIVGTATNIDMSSSVVEVAIDVNFPGESQTIATVLALPVNCGVLAEGQNRAGFHVSAGAETATGGGMRLISTVGRAAPAQVATGGNIRLVTE